MSVNVFFQPFVGKDYTTGGIFGKRIMVLGESHYCDEGCTDCGNVANHRECRTFTGGGGRVKVMAVNHPWTVLFHQWRKKLGEEMTT